MINKSMRPYTKIYKLLKSRIITSEIIFQKRIEGRGTHLPHMYPVFILISLILSEKLYGHLDSKSKN